MIIFGALILAGLYSLVCWAWGYLIGRRLNESTTWATSFALGHAALALIVQLIAVAGHFSAYYIAPLGVGLFFAIGLLRKTNFSTVDLKGVFLPHSLLTKLILLGVCLASCMLLVAAISYPGTDALAYYMAQPKLIAASGRYMPLPGYETFSVLPAVAEMAYAVMYVFGGETIGQIAAKLSIWPVFLAILALLWDLGRKLGLSVDAALLVVAGAVTSTAVTLVAWDGKTDLVGLMYALAALRWLPGLVAPLDDRRVCVMFGFMAACAVMAKFSYALILPMVLGIPLLCLCVRHPNRILHIGWWAGCAVIVTFALGWWSKNYFLYSDPFAPLFSVVASTPKFSLEQVWFGSEQTRWILSTYPLAITFGQYPMQHGGLSPLWLILLPALWARPWRTEGGRKALYLAVGGLVAVVMWMVFRPSVIAPRYFFPALLVPMFLLAFGFDRWRNSQRTMVKIAQIATIFLISLHIQYLGFVYHYVVAPFVASLRGQVGVLAVRDRAVALANIATLNTRCLLLSYSSEPLPLNLLRTFTPYLNLSKEDNGFEWAWRHNINCIIYDPITHKRQDIEKGIAAASIPMKKYEFAPNAYYLYILGNGENQDFNAKAKE